MADPQDGGSDRTVTRVDPLGFPETTPVTVSLESMLPLSVEWAGQLGSCLNASNGEHIAIIGATEDDAENARIAEFLRCACNSHHALVAALKAAGEWIAATQMMQPINGSGAVLGKLDLALKLAEGR